eukprot:1597691-Amphidinium_carterae.5
MGIVALLRDRPRWTQLVSALPHLVHSCALQGPSSGHIWSLRCSISFKGSKAPGAVYVLPHDENQLWPVPWEQLIRTPERRTWFTCGRSHQRLPC